jgi:adenylate cyclase
MTLTHRNIQLFNVKRLLLAEWRLFATTFGAAIIVIGIGLTGLLQGPEWAGLDLFFRLRSPEAQDARVVIVTITDPDITQVGAWPIPDAVLAQALTNIKAQQPRAIGLDIYRDLPVEPGHQKLVEIFQSTPNLIGAQKQFGHQTVPPPPALAKLDQVAFVDLLEDLDGRVRRDLLAVRTEAGPVASGFGSKLALMYLEAEQINLQVIPGATVQYQLGKARFNAFQGNDGAYVRADDNGYQVLLNFRGGAERFPTISLQAVLRGEIPSGLMRDRLVLIGSTAESTNDYFLTAYSSDRSSRVSQMAGVFVHANSASQMLSAALDGRALIHVWPDWVEGLWVLVWAAIGVLTSWRVLQMNCLCEPAFFGKAILGILLNGCGLGVISWELFLNAGWLPVVEPLLGLAIASLAYILFHGQNLQSLAYLDELTQVANRRCFDQQLARQIRIKGNLSLILCDIDCFKIYNDTYGHQAGDRCLQQVATALRNHVRATDLVARYGGEEFAIILPQADVPIAIQAVERVLTEIRALQLPNQYSIVGHYVTLSCGVASIRVSPHPEQSETLSQELIRQADRALYAAKGEGRNRYTVAMVNSDL